MRMYIYIYIVILMIIAIVYDCMYYTAEVNLLPNRNAPTHIWAIYLHISYPCKLHHVIDNRYV